MSFGYILLWLVGLSTISLFFRLIQPTLKIQVGWLITVCVLLFAITGISVFSFELAGIVGFWLWILLILLPQACLRRMESAAQDLKWKKAVKWASLARLFHPADGYWQLPRLLKLLSENSPSLAVQEGLFSFICENPYPVYQGLLAYCLSTTGKWQAYSEWFSSKKIALPNPKEEPIYFALYLRSLGESQQYHRLMETLQISHPVWKKLSVASRAILSVFAFAFSGRTQATEQALIAALSRHPEESREYWRATAEWAAGLTAQATARWNALISHPDPRVSQSAYARLQIPAPLASEWLTLNESKFIEQLEQDCDRDLLLSSRIAFSSHRPIFTQSLIVANLIPFVFSLYLGSTTNERILYRLGALVPYSVSGNHQYWRLLTAAFLHFGPVHLLMNLFALHLLGPFVENALGKFRFFAVYLLCAVLSMGSVTVISVWLQRGGDMLVGASGAIMGLIGVTAALFLRIRLTQRAPLASERLRAIALAMMIQTLFDLSNREVSFTAHASGFVIGFLLGLVVKHNLGSGSKGI